MSTGEPFATARTKVRGTSNLAQNLRPCLTKEHPHPVTITSERDLLCPSGMTPSAQLPQPAAATPPPSPGLKRVLWFNDLTLASVPSVGGKGANLGELVRAG